MDWTLEVREIDNTYKKVIYCRETKEVIVTVDNITDDFCYAIINSHNNDLMVARRQGVDISLATRKALYKLGVR